MRELKLERLEIINFKGIENFVFEPSGAVSTIHGDNGCGKTTVADAYAWLFTDNDNCDNRKFYLKPLDSEGVEKPGLKASVTGTFLFEGEPFVLSKVLSETFAGKGIGKIFNGHEISRTCNSLPVTKKKFIEILEEFCPQNVLKILLNSSYFNTLKTDVKRNLVLSLVDTVTQAEVIEGDEQLKELPEIIKPHTAEEYKKIAKIQVTAIKKKLEEIPVRIDEILWIQPNVDAADEPTVANNVKLFQKKITSEEKELAEIKAGDIVSVKENLLAKKENEVEALCVQHEAEINGKVDIEKDKAAKARAEVSKLNADKKEKESLIKKYEQLILSNARMIDKLKVSWAEGKAESFTPPHGVCHECGQTIPEADYKRNYEKGLNALNLKKAGMLKSINKEGKKLKAEQEKAEKQADGNNKDIVGINKKIKGKDEEIKKINDNIGKIKTTALNSPAYTQLLSEILSLKKEIKELQGGETGEKIATIEKNIEKARETIVGLNSSLARFVTKRKNEARIEELNSERRLIAKEGEQLESNISLVDRYIKRWVSMVEKPVNALFKKARFKMFEVQINGEIKDVCIPTYKGVPYNLALNKGHRKRIGMDIISTFSKHHNISMPVFVDNAEGVTVLPEMEGQVIRLVKPEITEENKKYYSKLQSKDIRKGRL